jgi:hypothetical protein
MCQGILFLVFKNMMVYGIWFSSVITKFLRDGTWFSLNPKRFERLKHVRDLTII